MVQIVEFPCLDLDKVGNSDTEYIDKLFVRVIRLFNYAWLFRYPCLREFLFDNFSKFKIDFTHFLKYYAITPIFISIKNPQSNALVQRVHQVV